MKNTKIKAILWDLDGTLVNTAELHYKATIATLTKYGYRFDREIFDSMFGMSDHTILRSVAPGMEETAFETMVIEKNALYRSLAEKDTLIPLPGVVQWLETFRSWGFRQVIVSTTFAENIDTLTRALKITAYFEELISTINMHLPSKPAPDGFLKAAEILKLPAEQCLVIEDATAGIASARAAGMKCLAVGTSRSIDNLQAADLVTPTLADVVEADVVWLLER